MLEVEVKIKTPVTEIANKLTKLGFIKGTTVYEHDIYYNGEHKDLKGEDKALRIREYRDLNSGEGRFVLNFKGPKIDNITMTREETEFEIPSFSHGETLFNGLGYYEAGSVEKTRTYYDKGKIECCLDKVTGLGEFIEIEIMAAEEDYDKSVFEIHCLVEELGLSMKDSITKSYLSMLQKTLN